MLGRLSHRSISRLAATCTLLLTFSALCCAFTSLFTGGAASILTPLSAIVCFSLAVLMLFLHRSYRTWNHLELHRKDSVLEALLREREKQKAAISDITLLYNSSLQFNNTRTDFFTNMTHELKTPLCVILGAIQLMEKEVPAQESKPEKLHRNLNIIRQNSYRLVRLINNILDIARIESGYSKLHKTWCEIVSFTSEIVQSVSPYAEQKGLQVRFHSQQQEIRAVVDPDKLERILLNLLSNAIKFTPRGGQVTVLVACRENQLVLTVADNGIGIPADMQALVFERFKQLRDLEAKTWEGSGLGLSIAHSFVLQHNGSITLKSQENQGSEFTITLPLTSDGDAGSIEDTHRQDPGRILETVQIELSELSIPAS